MIAAVGPPYSPGAKGGARVYMDALITPNRSLSQQGFKIMLGVLVAYNLLLMGFLIAIGAFPVPIFLGLDFVGLYIAFRVSYRRGGVVERVRVSADEVEVRRGRLGSEQSVWRSPTAFTRVEVEHASENEARVGLRMSERRLGVAEGLGPHEREAFADALRQAITRARAERRPGGGD